MSATKIMKQIKSQFAFENVKQSFNGKTHAIKTTDGKYVSMIPVGVYSKFQQSHLDQINSKLKEIKTFLCDEMFCELESFYENDGLVANFKASKNVTYSICVKVHHFNYDLDAVNDSKQVYIEIHLIKC